MTAPVVASFEAALADVAAKIRALQEEEAADQRINQLVLEGEEYELTRLRMRITEDELAIQQIMVQREEAKHKGPPAYILARQAALDQLLQCETDIRCIYNRYLPATASPNPTTAVDE